MNNSDFISLVRDCNGILIPSGDAIMLKKGTKVKITQSLGGDFTLYVNGNLVKINGNELRVEGKKKDDLQAVMKMIEEAKDKQFSNVIDLIFNLFFVTSGLEFSCFTG